jgi:serine/threonine protein kinase
MSNNGLHISNYPSNSNEIELHLFDHSNEDKITGYNKNPYRVNPFSSFINYIIEIFAGKQAIQVYVGENNRTQTNHVYVKVSALCDTLKINKKAFFKDIENKSAEEIFDFIKTGVIKEKIHGYTKLRSKEEIDKLLNTLSKKNIKTEQVAGLLNQKIFSSEKMAETLFELEKKIGNKNYKTRQSCYKISKTNDRIKKIENGKFYSINLITLETVEEDLYFHKICKLAKKLQVKEDVKLIHSLKDRISYRTILKLLNKDTKKNKKILINTFIFIGKEIEHSSEAPLYKKRSRNKSGKNTHAFEINSECILIAMEKLDEGAFKVVHEALKINNFSGQNFLEQVENYVRIKPNPKAIKNSTRENINNILIKESKAMELLKDNPYAMGPLSNMVYSQTQKVIFFQKRYMGGDGRNLKHVSVRHQLNALKQFGFGLNLIHKKNHIHLDVKLNNLLLDGDFLDKKRPIQGKVGDIGFITEMGITINQGTLAYLPPECFKKWCGNIIFNENCLANEKIDSFGFGMTILETILPKPYNELDIPILGFETAHQQFNNSVTEFYKKIEKKLLTNPTPENLKRIEMLKVSYQLVKFKPQDRLTCLEAAHKLELIEKTL